MWPSQHSLAFGLYLALGEENQRIKGHMLVEPWGASAYRDGVWPWSGDRAAAFVPLVFALPNGTVILARSTGLLSMRRGLTLWSHLLFQ